MRIKINDIIRENLRKMQEDGRGNLKALLEGVNSDKVEVPFQFDPETGRIIHFGKPSGSFYEFAYGFITFDYLDLDSVRRERPKASYHRIDPISSEGDVNLTETFRIYNDKVEQAEVAEPGFNQPDKRGKTSNIADIVRSVMEPISRETIDDAIRARDYKTALKISESFYDLMFRRYIAARKKGDIKPESEDDRQAREEITKIARQTIDIERLMRGK